MLFSIYSVANLDRVTDVKHLFLYQLFVWNTVDSKLTINVSGVVVAQCLK